MRIDTQFGTTDRVPAHINSYDAAENAGVST